MSAVKYGIRTILKRVDNYFQTSFSVFSTSIYCNANAVSKVRLFAPS